MYELGEYLIYLRKSRSDSELEKMGVDVLERHEQILLGLAKQMKLSIGGIYREVVSGDSISARPEMQKLLSEVESGRWKGVLVMEIERLARGDTVDQGIVQRAFQYSGTLIVTPAKVYNPDNEFDEEYFEFGLFMSRREYKTIKRRMQTGRYAAVREGKWPYNTAPYGFNRKKLSKEKGWTLELNEDESPVVRLIFSLYTGPNRIGVTKIKHELNQRGIKPRKSDRWTESTIRDILRNVVYDQQVKIGERKVVMTIQDGSPARTRPRTDDYIIVPGRQPRLIAHDIFSEAQSYLGLGKPKAPSSYGVKNPLAGLMVCSECKKKMIRRPASPDGKYVPYDLLMCTTEHCPTIGSPLDLVEEMVVQALSDWVKDYKLSGKATYESNIPEKEAILHTAQETHEQLLQQKEKLYDFLEQGIYSTEIFLERSSSLQQRISESSRNIQLLEKDLKEERERELSVEMFLPACEGLLDYYWNLSVQERNQALRQVIDSIEYKKLVKNKKGDVRNANFELTIKPKIPRK